MLEACWKQTGEATLRQAQCRLVRMASVDGIINFILGILLISFPTWLVKFLGIPSAPRFYPMILGGVLLVISIALFLERGILGRVGAGVGWRGCDQSVWWACPCQLARFWRPVLPLRGTVFLWALVALLLGTSTVEFITKNWTRTKRSRNLIRWGAGDGRLVCREIGHGRARIVNCQ